MKRSLFLYVLLCILVLLDGCAYNDQKSVYVGACIDKSDEWHDKLRDEIIQEAVKYPEIRLSVANAHGSTERQIRQMDSLLDAGVDLLIIVLEDPIHIQSTLDKAAQMHVPVVMNARNAKVPQYTASVGVDNVAVGKLMAGYVIDLANKNRCDAQHPLHAVELLGNFSAPTVTDRYVGLREGLEGIDYVSLYSLGSCDWSRQKACTAISHYLQTDTLVDVVLAQNDMMALGAADAVAQFAISHPIYILGVDAQTGHGRGVEAILNGVISASITNESSGDLLVKTAAAILRGEPYNRDSLIAPMLVDGSSGKLMRRMMLEMTEESKVIQILQLKVDTLWGQKKSLQITNGVLILFLLMAISMIAMVVWIYHFRTRASRDYLHNKRIMEVQQKQLEQITLELERVKTNQDKDNHFIDEFKKMIELHLDDSDYAIADLCDHLHVSRAQLFRKVKAATGVTPLEVIRQVRLRKARQLLRNTDMTIQQVGYSVGYTVPSYFSKSYKEFYGIMPSEEPRGADKK